MIKNKKGKLKKTIRYLNHIMKDIGQHNILMLVKENIINVEVIYNLVYNLHNILIF